LRARFLLTVAIDGQQPETLMETTVRSGDRKIWHRRSINLRRFELQRLTMCLSAAVEGAGTDGEPAAAWANPLIQSPRERVAQEHRCRRITDQERRVREQNLEALGYVE
jgi:hypothetical protein